MPVYAVKSSQSVPKTTAADTLHAQTPQG
jgi:hypothetical protein